MPTSEKHVKSIFDRALEMESDEERAAWLERTCANDAQLRRKVDGLLKAHEDAGSFLQHPMPATVMYEPVPEQVGSVVGPYKLREQIGEGGMGVVFVAEQTKPVRRKVALKLIKPGLDTQQVIARFEAERQALALMEHPNIAKVLDGGTTGNRDSGEPFDASPRSDSNDLPGLTPPGSPGRPYFVMELVRGIPITKYCDEHRLTTRQRLELFITVCRAVQHAHQKGIIHRDLKPGNVLVTRIDGAAVPKVIDFGVAKAIDRQLSEQTVYTQFAALIGTPAYMSPEQAELTGVDIDTRSDVYSLGVLLYELLTGTTPFHRQMLKQAAPLEKMRIIREDEAPKPSARLSTLNAAQLSTISERRGTDARRLNDSVRGELDWIVMRAMDKDRNRRYESASAFAADVERFIAGEPVEACPPSAWYRFMKFATRNKGVLTSAILFTFALVAGTGVSLWQASVAHKHRRIAEQNSDRAERQSKVIDRQRLQAEKRSLTHTRALENLLNVFAAFQPTAAHCRELLAAVEKLPLKERIIAYRRIGDFFVVTGNYRNAVIAYDEAILADSSYMRAFLCRGDVHYRQRQFRKAMRDYSRVIESKRLLDHPLYNPFARRAFARLHSGRQSSGIVDLREAHRRHPVPTLFQLASGFLGTSVFFTTSDGTVRQECLRMANETVNRRPESDDARLGRAILLFQLEEALLAKRDVQELVNRRASRQFGQAHYRIYSFDPLALLALAVSGQAEYRTICRTIISQFAYTTDDQTAAFIARTVALGPHALDDYSIAEALARRATRMKPYSRSYKATLGAVLYRAGRTDEAIKLLDGETGESPGNVDDVAFRSFFLALAMHRKGQPEIASKVLRKAIEATKRAEGDDITPPRWHRRLTFQILRKEAMSSIASRQTPVRMRP